MGFTIGDVVKDATGRQFAIVYAPDNGLYYGDDWLIGYAAHELELVRAASTGTRSRLEPVAVADLLQDEYPPLCFLVDGLIALGNFAILGGRAKSGKSWLALQLAHCVDAGLPFLGRETQRAGVLYYALEDGARRVQSRIKAIGWRPSASAFVHFSIANLDDGQGGPGPGINELYHYSQYFQLIVIDTLTAAMSGRTDERDNSSMGAIVNGLARLAHDEDKAILLVHHTGKSAVNQDDVFTSLRGASAIRGGYDVGLILERKPGEREGILHAESRDLDIRNMTLRQAANGAGWDYVGDAAEIERIRAGRKVLEAMLEHDADGNGMTAKALAQVRGVSETTVYNQLKRLEEAGYVNRLEQPSTAMGKRPDVWQVDRAYTK